MNDFDGHETTVGVLMTPGAGRCVAIGCDVQLGGPGDYEAMGLCKDCVAELYRLLKERPGDDSTH